MKTFKKQADELVKLHFGEIANAITSVEYAIGVLQMCLVHEIIDTELDIQEKILIELKNRL